MSEAYEDRLEQAARRLATAVGPERDLWPGIAEAIEQPQPSRRSPWLAQAAAVVLLVGGSSAITYLLTSDDARLAPVVAPEFVFERASFGGDYNLGVDFQTARNGLAAGLDEALARLSPATQAEIRDNLGHVHAAIADINTALEREPDNVQLQQQLLRAYREELALLRRVGGLTHSIMLRNDI